MICVTVVTDQNCDKGQFIHFAVFGQLAPACEL